MAQSFALFLWIHMIFFHEYSSTRFRTSVCRKQLLLYVQVLFSFERAHFSVRGVPIAKRVGSAAALLKRAISSLFGHFWQCLLVVSMMFLCCLDAVSILSPCCINVVLMLSLCCSYDASMLSLFIHIISLCSLHIVSALSLTSITVVSMLLLCYL